MAKITGKDGRIYYADQVVVGDGISFEDSAPNYYIHDSASGLAGFAADDLIEIKSGSGANDGEFTLSAKTAAKLTTSDVLTTETAITAGRVTLVSTAPDTNAAGFYNWSLDRAVDIHECTTYADAGIKKYIAALKDWTATADKYWFTDNSPASLQSWLATEKWIRFFIVYNADPTTTTCYYYEGLAKISGVSSEASVSELISEPLTFQGTGSLYYVTRTTAWKT